MADELAELRARLERREGRAQVRAEARARRVARKSRQGAAELRQRAALAGERARVRHQVAQSGEARAMRVERTRTVALALLLPVLTAFGAWSAAGVQAGMVALLGLPEKSPAAWAAWLVEPALIGIVAGIILIRARLRSAGGDLDERATKIEAAALTTSVLLNMAGHWPGEMTADAVGALAGHALGPLGAAATAYLISVVQDGVTAADPWTLPDGRPAPVLTVPEDTAESASEERPATVWPVPVAGRRTLPIVSRRDIPRAVKGDMRGDAPRAIEAPKATRRRKTSRDTGRVMGDADRTAAARAVLADEPDISGAALGRRLGLSARQGQRLLSDIRAADPVPGQMSLDDTGARGTRGPVADDAPVLALAGGDR